MKATLFATVVAVALVLLAVINGGLGSSPG
jgi:hypothetical protein